MLELKRTDVLPGRSVESGVELLQGLSRHLSVREVEGVPFVNAGHKIPLKTSSREVVMLFCMKWQSRSGLFLPARSKMCAGS